MWKFIWSHFTWFVNRISNTRTFSRHYSTLATILMIICTTAVSTVYFHFNPEGTANICLIYIVGVMWLSYHTDKYRYGIIAAIFSVFCINYLFTYPFHDLNFTMAGYPMTFLFMYFISILTGAAAFRLKDQSEKILEAEKLLAEAEKEKLRANLLRAVSHDLRTPLTSMIGASSSYLENEDRLSPEEKRELVTHICEDSNWLLHMVENLLSVTRITDATSNILKKTPEPVEEVIFDAISTAKKRYPEMQVRTSIPEDFLVAPMDPLLIKQVILNLLENVYYHAHSRKPTDCILDSDEHNVCIHIRDYGDGIEPSRLDSIFDAAPSAPTSAADTRKGMGIGLSICKAIIKAHNGQIYAVNHDDGAEFYFTLPKEEIQHESDH